MLSDWACTKTDGVQLFFTLHVSAVLLCSKCASAVASTSSRPASAQPGREDLPCWQLKGANESVRSNCYAARLLQKSQGHIKLQGDLPAARFGLRNVDYSIGLDSSMGVSTPNVFPRGNKTVARRLQPEKSLLTGPASLLTILAFSKNSMFQDGASRPGDE